MSKLYLDDKRTPIIDGWDVVRNYEEFENYLNTKGLPDEVSFDHDLHDEHYHPAMYKGQLEYNKLYRTFIHKTGLNCAIFLNYYCDKNNLTLPLCNVHSYNPVGRQNIYDYLVGKMMWDGDEDPIVTMNDIPHVL